MHTVELKVLELNDNGVHDLIHRGRRDKRQFQCDQLPSEIFEEGRSEAGLKKDLEEYPYWILLAQQERMSANVVLEPFHGYVQFGRKDDQKKAMVYEGTAGEIASSTRLLTDLRMKDLVGGTANYGFETASVQLLDS
ncbi:MAG: hypothetical protein QF824_03100 [Candidatus Woesearchaeota archaeon]|nr:hypothetical protein [Candidatus Woesearchaeota archaeon]